MADVLEYENRFRAEADEVLVCCSIYTQTKKTQARSVTNHLSMRKAVQLYT